MLSVWHPKRWMSLCMSEDEKNETEPFFTQNALSILH